MDDAFGIVFEGFATEAIDTRAAKTEVIKGVGVRLGETVDLRFTLSLSDSGGVRSHSRVPLQQYK